MVVVGVASVQVEVVREVVFVDAASDYCVSKGVLAPKNITWRVASDVIRECDDTCVLRTHDFRDDVRL